MTAPAVAVASVAKPTVGGGGGGTVSFVGSSTTGITSGDYGHTSISEPAGCASGDLMVLAAFNNYSNTQMSTPSGWTFYARVAADSGGGTPRELVTCDIFYRFRAGTALTPALSFSAGGDQMAIMHAYRGVNATTPIQAYTSYGLGTPRTFSPTTLTAAAANSFIAAFCGSWSGAPSAMAATGLTFTARSLAGVVESSSFSAPVASAGATGALSVSGGDTTNGTHACMAILINPT